MDRFEKYKLEKRREETSLKTMYFNRFLLIRYITAIFFFLNLYWLFSLVMCNSVLLVVPGLTLIFIVRAVWEQCTMYSSPIDNAEKTILVYKIILSINIMLIVALFTPLFNELFPFLENSMKAYGFVFGINFIGMILCGISLRRLLKIKNRTDKQLIYVKQLEKTFS